MTSFKWLIAGMIWAAMSVTAFAADAKFTAGPAVAKDGDKLKVSFTVSAATDVAVAIVDAKGEIVRHLAGGVLGKNPPAPLQADSLSQTLTWDGQDDDGKAPAGGPFKVTVSLGLKVSYAGVAFAESDKPTPNRIEAVLGLAVLPDGRLIVLDRCSGWGWWQGTKAHVLRRDGTYDKTIKPYSPALAMDRIKAFGPFVNSFGSVNPIFYRPEGISLYPHDDAPHQPAVTPDGRIVLADWLEMSAYGSGPGVLGVIDADGGCPEPTYGGPSLGSPWKGYPFLAAAPDGKAVYITGLGKGGAKQPTNAVLASKLPDRTPPEVFFGEPDKSGDDNAHLNDPRGLAVDGKGHLLIADFGNNRVVVLNEKDKSFAGSFPVEAPTWVAAHPKTGAVYVSSKRTTVIKFSGFADAKEQARLDISDLLNKIGKAYQPGTLVCLALDSTGDSPVLWAGVGNSLVRYEDQGTKFSAATPAGVTPAKMFWRAAADPTHKQVACRIGGSWDSALHVLDDATGKVRVLGREVAGTEGRLHRLGPDGCIYGVDHAAGVIRYTPDGKPKPFEATAKDPYLRGRLPAGNTGTTSWERDFWVDRKNDIYVRKSGVEYHGHMTVQVYDQGGNFKRTAIWMVSDAMYGPRVDTQGNIYIMDLIKPEGQPFPDEFKDRLTIGKRTAHWYDWIYGSVIKFGPAGGAIWFAGKQATPVDYEGWRLTGSNSVSGLRTTGGNLIGTIAKKPAELAMPVTSLDAVTQKAITFRLKNDSDGAEARLGWHVVGEPYGTAARLKTIAIKPSSDFAEYTFDLAEEKDWKGGIYGVTLSPTNGAKGSFAIDYVRVGAADSKVIWNFNADDSQDVKLPDTLKKENVGTCAYMLPATGTVLQGATWYRPGFSHIGNTNNNDHCHCTGNDFDMDDYGRIFAPDSGRFRVGVLDANGNELLSFGGYGNQDFCGTDSYVLDPTTKLLRPRQASDPKDLASPFAKPEIPFGWIIGVAVTDRYAYVTDLINKRVLRVKLDYATSETVAAP